MCAELKARCPGIKVALMVDFFVGHRMDRARVDAFPDVIMTTNELARDEVAQKWQHAISSDCVVNVGSTYLESLAIDATPPALDSAEVMARLSSLGVRKGDVAVPFFVSPDDMVPGATDSIASCLAEFAKGVSTANAALGDGVSMWVARWAIPWAARSASSAWRGVAPRRFSALDGTRRASTRS